MPTMLHLPCSTYHSQPVRKNIRVIVLLNSYQYKTCQNCHCNYINSILNTGGFGGFLCCGGVLLFWVLVGWLGFFKQAICQSMVYHNPFNKKQTQHTHNKLPGLSLMERLSMKMMWKVHKNELKLKKNKEQIFKTPFGLEFFKPVQLCHCIHY